MHMTPDTKECHFCGETIKAIAKKCKHCGEFLDSYTQEPASNDKVSAEIGENASNIIVGKYITQNVTWGKSRRDEHYEIAMNWEQNPKKPWMRGVDLANRNLSQLNLL